MPNKSQTASSHHSVSSESLSSSSLSESDQDSEEGDHEEDLNNLYELAESRSAVVPVHRAVKPARKSTNKMRNKFAKLVLGVSESLKKKEVTVGQLTLYLSTIEAVDAVCTTVVEARLLFNRDTIKEFDRECHDIEDVLKMLKGYYSWFNFHLIKDIAKMFCKHDDEITKQIKIYKGCMKNYCQKRLYKLPRDTLPLTKDAEICVFKIDEEWNTMRISQIKPVKSIICSILNLKKVTLRFRSASTGCVELTFDIPQHIAEIVFPLSACQVNELKENYIQYRGKLLQMYIIIIGARVLYCLP